MTGTPKLCVCCNEPLPDEAIVMLCVTCFQSSSVVNVGQHIECHRHHTTIDPTKVTS